ncbi:MAG: hypothetical protein JF593_08455 [Novosphingobium sp.]|nr:hypothetical protein [Novosphingobium sp.]
MRIVPIPAAIAGLLAATALGPAPAAAQDTSGDKMNMVIVYGNDPCPQSRGSEITVCARKDEAERYRIPAPFRNSASPQNEAWTNKVVAYETVGAAGTMSCSPTGAGGWTGCAHKLINAAYAEKKNSPDVQFSQMIDAERQKRLSTIDTEAAATQARVEQLEKNYQARQAASDTTPAATAVPGKTTPNVSTQSAVPNTVGTASSAGK